MPMNNIEKAKGLLSDDNYTLVLCKDDSFYTSKERGVAPLIEFIDSKTPLKGYSAADKVIGKSIAFLYVIAGVSEVYSPVMSEGAIKVFEDNNIKYSADKKVEYIINRMGDGICPVEKSVLNIKDPNKAYIRIKETLKKLRSI